MEVKNQVYRVSYKQGDRNAREKPVNVYDRRSGMSSGRGAVPLPAQIIARYAQTELGVSKVRAVELAKRLSRHVRMLDDDTGRIMFLQDNRISNSTIYELMGYFLRGAKRSSDKSTITRPLDTELFLNTLKRARIPASWLTYVHVQE
jgi:hypothetical protein